ncbi:MULTISPECIES: response regulator transcription factor [Pontibacillus]|uniref:Response regulator n=1 Tax=Pontibacillus chungwhensis TaxID=265426 RepID=A0ABY8UZD6_9BACI|nr:MULTISPECIES: response regulator [Pontibacillus]MCD5324176.1 response regulator [Pontibacillus sp. HN14]WIF97765.1 response regulator [Pontibacillus chungwhensis]
MNVLLVDDEPMMLEQLKMMIEPQCPLWNLYPAADGSQAMHLSEEKNFQLAFLDIEMPGRSGLELAEDLKKKFPNIEIVMITAHQDFEYAKQSIKVGVAEYLTKPLIESELREVVKRFANDVDFMEYSQLVISALHIVHEEYDEALNLPNVANKIHVNPSYLSRRFSDEVGQSFSEYVTNYRVDMAKTLLKANKDKSISDIAEQVGFNRLHYFSTTFKKKLGVSPKEYRERSD